MTYLEALRWLYSFTDYEMTPLSAASAAKLELAPLRDLLARLGDPQRGRHSVHITGSKGKGSTAAMIEAILRAAGERTGLFTSPHLHHETERYRIDGEPIAQDALVRLVEQIEPHVAAVFAGGGRLTTFDLRTALGFLAFRDAGVTWQVIEVGLGGRLDSTNVLDEKNLCVFTPVSLEHTEVLGNTVAEIATDKSGILRRGTRAVMAPQRESAADIFRARCAELDVSLEEVATACALSIERSDTDNQTFRLQTPRTRYHLTIPLLGRHQVENAATAVLGVENLPGVEAGPDVVRSALAEVRWPGRLEIVKRRPLVVLDGAHNIDSAKRLVQALRSTFSPRR
ncbi:MAG: folylpolyglutamate synthase/dihydrofolate synthase family protein, partial [Dehalococcoidia bacterium]